MELMEFEFKGEVVEFEPKRSDVMVNATQMAKIFGKEVSGFLKTDSTKKFVEAYCGTEDIPPQDEFTPNGKLVKVISTGKNNGTWMDRRVALKFAAWLDPFFEVWVYKVIDELLFGEIKVLRESIVSSAEKRARIDELRKKLNSDEDYVELLKLELEDKKLSKSRAKESFRQLNAFKEQFLQEKLNTKNVEQ
jgi:hypothetical protein